MHWFMLFSWSYFNVHTLCSLCLRGEQLPSLQFQMAWQDAVAEQETTAWIQETAHQQQALQEIHGAVAGEAGIVFKMVAFISCPLPSLPEGEGENDRPNG